MKIYMIRHAQTPGNQEYRYVGCRTDESISEQGAALLKKMHLPQIPYVYVSPMKRCIQSAEILYPGIKQQVVPDFQECDFGTFEGKNYIELNGDLDYQAWIDSGGELPFPKGESRKEFAERTVNAFDALNLFERDTDCALVVHGGTIMAIMEEYAKPHGTYFDFQPKCGEGYILDNNGSYEQIKAK